MQGDEPRVTRPRFAFSASPNNSSLLFRAVPDSGVAPLLVRWQVTNETGRPLVQYELDARGSGTFGPPMTTLDGLVTTFTTPGAVHPVLRATDEQGTAYTAATAVTVEGPEDVTARFRELWDAFKARLMTGDVSGALASVAPSLQPRLNKLFQQVGPDLPQLAFGLGELTVLNQVGDLTEAFVVEPEGGTAFVYFVYFRRDGLGRWLIEEM